MIFLILIIVACTIVMLYAWILTMIQAWRVSIWWFLGSLFFSFPVWWIFIFLNWKETKGPFLIYIAGLVPLMISVFVLSLQAEGPAPTPAQGEVVESANEGSSFFSSCSGGDADEEESDRPEWITPNHESQQPDGTIRIRLNPDCRARCELLVYPDEAVEPFKWKLEPGESRNLGIVNDARLSVNPQPPFCRSRDKTLTPAMVGTTITYGCGK